MTQGGCCTWYGGELLVWQAYSAGGCAGKVPRSRQAIHSARHAACAGDGRPMQQQLAAWTGTKDEGIKQGT